MTLLMIRNVGLTLVLLLSCLGSAPLGSMEQDPAGVPERSIASRALAPAQVAPGIRQDDPWMERDHRSPSPTHQILLPFPAPPGPGVAAVASISRECRGAAPRTLPPRICERLPYDANAPPTPA